ncbi:MAG TPA: hypothetical protein VFB62_03050 [Polyangiaceae bacterium]|nr:hypothetical protein [Polyangiaceae bacterium]
MKITSAVVVALVMACGSTVETLEDTGSSTGNASGGATSAGSSTGGSSAGGSSVGGSGGGTVTTDMFACNVAYDCIQDIGHLGPVPPEALRCGGELVTSGEPGAVLVTSQPGPYPTFIETLVVLLGDGKLYQQMRSRCANDTDCEGQNTSEWKLFPLELCDVEVDPADIAGCGDPNGTCEWLAYGANCTPAPRAWTCQDLP